MFDSNSYRSVRSLVGAALVLAPACWRRTRDVMHIIFLCKTSSRCIHSPLCYNHRSPRGERSRVTIQSLTVSLHKRVCGSELPNVDLDSRRHFIINSRASVSRPQDLHVHARLYMVASMSGCSSPNTFFLVSITRICSSSASLPSALICVRQR